MALADAVPFAVAQWTLDEAVASGSRADSVGANAFTDVNTVAFTTGKFGNAARCVGANSESLTASGPSVTTAHATIGGWVRYPGGNPPTSNEDFAFKVGGSGGFILSTIRADHGSLAGHTMWNYYNGGAGAISQFSATPLANDAGWHLVLMSYDGTNVRLYRDGALEGTVAHTTGLGATGNSFTLTTSGTTIDFDDWVVLEGYALSGAEVSAWWAGGAGVAFADWAGGGGGGPSAGAKRRRRLLTGAR